MRVEFKDSRRILYHEFSLFSRGGGRLERKIQNKFVFVGRHQREDTTGMKDAADMEREWLNFRFSTALHTRTHNLTVFLSLVAVSERWLKTFHSLVSAHIASSSAASSLPTNQLVQSHTQINTQTHTHIQCQFEAPAVKLPPIHVNPA